MEQEKWLQLKKCYLLGSNLKIVIWGVGEEVNKNLAEGEFF